MKIAYFTSNRTTFPPSPDQIAASTAVTMNIMNKLKSKHDITLYAAQGSHIEGIRIVDLNVPPFNTDSSIIGSDWTTKAVLGMKQLFIGALLNHAHEYDLIHIQTEPVYLGFSYASLVKTPILFTSHNMFHTDEDALFRFYDKKVHLSALSHKQASLIPVNSLPVIHNGIDIERFTYSDNHEDYFLFLGRMTDEKGIHQFLSLAERLPHIPFVIAGKGGNEITSQVISFCNNHSNTRFLGMLPYGSESWLTALSSAKALIMPITYDDPCPLVPLEAMACGTPIIGFDKGSLPEQITQTTGRIVAFDKSITGLSDAVTELAEMNNGQYKQMRSAARNHVATHFTADIMAQKYEDLYKKIVDSTQ